jgi:hypothetical protein
LHDGSEITATPKHAPGSNSPADDKKKLSKNNN